MNFFNLDERNKYKLFYSFTFIIRRTLFIATGFMLSDFGGIQIICLNYINLAQFIYFGKFKPFKTRKRNIRESINEIII